MTDTHFPMARLVRTAAVVAALICLGAPSAPAQSSPKFRKLAPGVLTSIPPEIHEDDTVSAHDIHEFRVIEDLPWKPDFAPASETLFEKSGQYKFRHALWCLEFSFKPLRMIYVNVPQPSGRRQRKLIWYMVYRVKNTGYRRDPGEAKEAPADQTRSFLPLFVLRSHEYEKAYLDRVIPAAIGPIRRREDPQRALLSTAEIISHELPVSTDRMDRSVWGVATWEDIDPRLDFFSINVHGLTNSYRWVDPQGAYQAGDPPGKGRRFQRKVLQLNFWRPGDDIEPHEREIRFGIPPENAHIYGPEEGLAYRWVFR